MDQNQTTNGITADAEVSVEPPAPSVQGTEQPSPPQPAVEEGVVAVDLLEGGPPEPPTPEKGRFLPFVLIAVLLIALAAAWFLRDTWKETPPEPGTENMQITAELVDETHIAVDSMFTVTGAFGLGADTLRERLSIEPETAFSLSAQGEEGSFNLYPETPFAQNTQVRIIYRDPNTATLFWEFRTVSAFAVTGVFPADGAVGVPPSSAVEIFFSRGGFNENTLGDYITVSPETPGSFIGRDDMVLFIPEERYLPAMTTFTVTVSGGLAAGDGQTLGSDYSFSFTTGVEETREFRFSNANRPTENIVSGEDAMLKLTVGEALWGNNVDVAVYRYPNANAYLRALQAYQKKLEIESNYTTYSDYDNWEADVSGLDEFMCFESPLYSKEDNYYGEYYVMPPEKIADGWYAARIEVTLPSGTPLWTWKYMQVGEFSVYTAQSRSLSESGNTMVAWVNSTATGGAIANAAISVSSSNYNVAATTDLDGVALLEGKITPVARGIYDVEEDGTIRNTTVIGILTVRDGGKIFHDLYGYATNGVNYFNTPDLSNDYYGYLFTDRPLYRHTDTMKVWGMVRPRYEGAPALKALSINYGGAYSVPVTPGADGTFQLEIPLEAYAESWMRLRLVDDTGSEYASIFLVIEDFVKPEYETTATVEKPVYTLWSGEAVNIDFTAHYFEGTPAKAYSARVIPTETYYTDCKFDEVPLQTDDQGGARVSIKPQDNNRDTYRPQRVVFDIFNTDPLNTTQVQQGTAHIFLRDTILKLTQDDTPNRVTVRTNKVDISRITREADLLAEENYTGAPVDATLSAVVHRYYYERIPSGERYDPITKQAVTAYEYNYKEEVAATYSARTQNGVYVFEDLPHDDPDSNYWLEITVTDGQGLSVRETLYYQTATVSRGDRHYFQFAKRKPATTEAADTVYGTDWIGYPFTDGERCELFLTDNGEEVMGGRAFYTLSQDAIFSYGPASGTEFSADFSARGIPNYIVSGAYFDGKHVYGTYFMEMVYQPEKRALDIEIAADRESYNPGDTAKLTFKVTDRTTGEPAANAVLVAAVVDEAVFALQEQKPDFLKTLYRLRSYTCVYQYTSYDPQNLDGGGMGGGGDGPFSPRTDFEDTALFTAIRTDASGVATAEVKLPDNLTSWRVTALSLTDDLKAGDDKSRFEVSLDFFISPVMPPRLLEGDDFVLTAHAAGREVSPDSTVSYTVTAEGREETYTATGRAGDFTPVVLKGLPAGEHKITVSGTMGEMRDALTLPLSVVKSGVNVTVSRRMPLAEAAKLTSTTYPVTLGFYDKSYELAAEILTELAAHPGGRTDQRIAAHYLAQRMLISGVPRAEIDAAALSDSFVNVCPDWQLYRLFPYSEPDIGLTVRAYLADPSSFRGDVPYYYSDTDTITDPAIRAACYLLITQYRGDASPVLEQELRKTVYSFQDKMYLITAMTFYKDEAAKAKEWYKELCAPRLTAQTDANGQTLFSVDGNHVDTAAALVAATATGAETEAAGLARWLLANPSKNDLYLLELLYYQRQIPVPAGSSRVTYTQDGRQTLELEKGIVYRVFSKEQLEAAEFSGTGEVWVSARYTAGLDDAMRRDQNKFTVTKTVTPAEGDTLRPGELAKITVRVDIPDDVALEEYDRITLEDYVPTGMRYASTETAYNGWNLSTKNDQRLSFEISRKYNRELVYYARCVAPGDYVLESAFVSLSDGSLWGVSERAMVSVSQ